MIHGEKDAYIGPDIARALFAEAREPKELWIVPKAKHNRCREVAPDEYAARSARSSNATPRAARLSRNHPILPNLFPPKRL